MELSDEQCDDNKKGNDEQDTLHFYDCGGHHHYILINSMTLTRKSLFIIVFKASHYKSHEESYHRLIGGHIEMVLGKDPEACLLLVGSWWDEAGILIEQQEVDNLFKIVKLHIRDRIKGSSKPPKLIECGDTKLFQLSNKQEDHLRNSSDKKALSKTQQIIQDALSSIFGEPNNSLIEVPLTSFPPTDIET